MGADHERKLCNIENQIADEACQIIQEETEGLDSETGGYNPGHLWKLKDKIKPKQTQVPTAMKGPNGELLTTKDDLKMLLWNIIKKVLRNRNNKENMQEHKKKQDIICRRRLEQTKLIKTDPWTKEEFEEVLKGLKNKKSKDPNQYANEIFDPKVAREDLINAILAQMNKIKSDQVYPKCLELCNITSLYKKKRTS